MGTNKSSDVLRGFLLPHDIDQTNIDTTNSSFTQAGNRAGDPVPQQVSKLIVRASGEQTADSDIQIKTQRAGHPGRGGNSFGLIMLLLLLISVVYYLVIYLGMM